MLKTDPAYLCCTLLHLPRDTRSLGSSRAPGGRLLCQRFSISAGPPDSLHSGWLAEGEALDPAPCTLPAKSWTFFTLGSVFFFFLFFLSVCFPTVNKASEFLPLAERETSSARPCHGGRRLWKWEFVGNDVSTATPTILVHQPAPMDFLLKYQLPRGFH